MLLAEDSWMLLGDDWLLCDVVLLLLDSDDRLLLVLDDERLLDVLLLLVDSKSLVSEASP